MFSYALSEYFKLPVSYKQRLPAPFEDSALALGDGVEFYLDLRHGQHVGRCAQHPNEIVHYYFRAVDTRHGATYMYKIKDNLDCVTYLKCIKYLSCTCQLR